MGDQMNKARQHQQLGELAAAEEICRRHVDSETAETGAALALLAIIDLQQSRREEGRAHLARARRFEADNPAWQSDLTAGLILLGELSPARDLLLQAVGDAAADAVAFNRLGTVCLSMGDLEGAEAAYGQAIERGFSLAP